MADDSGELKLRMPARFDPGSVKGAAWQVLTDVGPEGMTVIEITRQIQLQHLRDLRTSKTPEVHPIQALPLWCPHESGTPHTWVQLTLQCLCDRQFCEKPSWNGQG